jgi:hypothetical protein
MAGDIAAIPIACMLTYLIYYHCSFKDNWFKGSYVTKDILDNPCDYSCINSKLCKKHLQRGPMCGTPF